MYGMNYGYNYQNNYQIPTDERIWVQNQQAAEAYLVVPNSFVRLWDSQKPVFYEKRADATGRPLPLDVYSYQKIEPVSASNSITQGNELEKQIKALNERILALEKELGYEYKSDTDDSGVQ